MSEIVQSIGTVTTQDEHELAQFEFECFMEAEDEKAIEGLTQQNKCDHGIYIAKGDTRALYCTACNPGYSRIMRPPVRVILSARQERTLDTAEYCEQPISERLTFAEQLEDITL